MPLSDESPAPLLSVEPGQLRLNRGSEASFKSYLQQNASHAQPRKTLLLNPSSFSKGEGNGTPLQCSCLDNPTDGGAWWAAVHGVTKSRTRLSEFTFTFHFPALEKEMAAHSSVLAGESQGRQSLVGCRLWGRTESDTTEVT